MDLHSNNWNWNTFLEQQSHNPNELTLAAHLASDWVTCACGEKCKALPRDKDFPGMPADIQLQELGSHFYYHIMMMSRTDGYEESKLNAISYLEQIEERTKFLLDNPAE